MPKPATIDGKDLEFAIFEMTPDLVCIASKEGYFKKVNPAVIAKLGYTLEELMSRPIKSFVHPDDQERTRATRERMLKGEPLRNFENRYIKKNGRIVWLQWTSIYNSDSEQVFAIAKDITEKKRAEKKIRDKYQQFKSMADHFKASLEQDRKYLATEIHEELAQMAAVIRMDLDWLESNISGLSTVAKDRLEHSRMMTDLLMNAMRRISFSLSPRMIDDLGLIATLQWHCKEFSLLNGIPCKFILGIKEEELPAHARVDLFRICQEALTNIMYHASATEASIALGIKQHSIVLEIRDNGIGFDPSLLKKSRGLTTMRERAASLDAQLEIISDPGSGTLVRVELGRV